MQDRADYATIIQAFSRVYAELNNKQPTAINVDIKKKDQPLI
ncbi:hypothetical protein ACDQ55_05975 [Chitinophaga sp. 30R24]